MLPLELEDNIRIQFKNLNRFEKNEEIEKFIKDNLRFISI